MYLILSHGSQLPQSWELGSEITVSLSVYTAVFFFFFI